jgi:dipeptidyl aminopeptidase/acylaminoacyl peptidase
MINMTKNPLRYLTFSIYLGALAIWGQQPAAYPVKEFLGKTHYLRVEAAPDARHVAILTTKHNWIADQKEWTVWNLRASDAGATIQPRAVAVSNGVISSPRWSADGRYFAYRTTQKDSVARLAVYDVTSGKSIDITSKKTSGNGVSAFNWSADGRNLYFVVDDTPSLPKNAPVTFPKAQDPDAHSTFYLIAATDFGKGEPRVLTSMDDDAPQDFVVLPGETKIAALAGLAIFVFDIKDPKKAKRLTPWLGCATALRSVPKGLVFQACAGVPGGNLVPNAVSVRTQRRLYLLDPVGGKLEQLARDYDGELWSRDMDTTPEGDLIANGLKSTKWTLYKINAATGRQEAINTPDTAVSHLSVARNGKLVAFATIGDGEVYLAKDLESLVGARKVTNFNSAFNAVPRPESRTVRWSNGEGDEVEGVLYFPPGKTDARGLPAVVVIHGGPWMARSEPYYAPLAGGPVDEGLLLASRGYLVLAPNYRGSTGRGDGFLSVLDGYPCSRPVADILTGVDLVVSKGWADPDRIGVMGGSYGGLLTNCIIGRTTRFKAAATAAAGWNLTSAFTDSPSFTGRAKTPWDDMRLFWEEAPISRAGNIKTPTLIIHGEADTTVSPEQAREMATALRRLRVPNEVLIFPGEGHGFTTPSNDRTQTEAKIAWLDHYLLGKPLPAAKQ